MPRLSTDYTGTVQRKEGVLMGPYGDNFTETLSTLDFTGFAGGFWDSENNGEHFGAREYQNTHGSWLSPDPAGMATVDITNPQSWNRYAYALNNPVSFVDPFGLDCATVNDDGSVTTASGDCDPNANNQFYFDGTVDPNSAFVDANGDVRAIVDGSGACSGDCSSASMFTYYSQVDATAADLTGNTGTAGAVGLPTVSAGPPNVGPSTEPQVKAGCLGPALWAGGKATAEGLIPVPPQANLGDPVSATGDLATSKPGQALALGVLYQTANAARFLAPFADYAADFVPFAGQAWLVYQGVRALAAGGKAFKESGNRCYGGN